jgi:hypothetical protein
MGKSTLRRKEPRAKEAPPVSARERLVAAARGGGVTLVLGAGVSIELGVPNWRGLAVRVWQKALASSQPHSLADVAHIEKAVADPQLFPIIFELAQQRLGPRSFVETLRQCLYETAANGRDAPLTSLGAIAAAICRDHNLRARRRIARVVTFNADELLREALRRYYGTRGKEGQWFRTVDHAVSERPLGRGDQPVTIYHVHGFLPRPNTFGESLSEHRLVFTDSQYWDSGTAQASLANRTMNAALSDSHCIFIGLSMTDPNLLRWLALRHNEILREAALQAPAILGEGARRRQVKGGEKSNAAAVPDSAHSKEESEPVKRRLSSSLAGHFWIRTPDADPTGLLSEFLLHRGVEAVEIPSWGSGNFAELLDEMFPAAG